MLLITAYFCMGTELRFLKQLKTEGFENSPDAEFWHGKALELSVRFLPGDAPLVKHIVSSYAKHHAPTSERIPESEEVTSRVRVIKPLEGIVYNKVSPVIKEILKPSVKLSPLDLQPNDYVSEFLDKLNFRDASKSNNEKSKIEIDCEDIPVSKSTKRSPKAKPQNNGIS